MLTTDDKTEIGALIVRWNESLYIPWQGDLASATMSEADAAEARNAYVATVNAIGTKQFLDRYGDRDVVGYLEEQRKDGLESVDLAHEIQVLSLEPLGQLPNGDLVIKATVWVGTTTGSVDVKSGKLTHKTKIDQTPVHVYGVQKTDSGWRLDAEYRYYQRSRDGDLTQYGPDTPHDTMPPVSEWRLD